MARPRYKKAPMSRANSWPRPAPAPADTITDLSAIAALLKLLDATPPLQALGVCAAFFHRACDAHPAALRMVLHEPVVKQGFVGVSLLAELNRVAR